MLSKGQESWEKYSSLDGEQGPELWRGPPHPPPNPWLPEEDSGGTDATGYTTVDLELVPFPSVLLRHCTLSPQVSIWVPQSQTSGQAGDRGDRGNHSNLNLACWSREVTPRQNKSKPQKKGRQSHVCYLLLEEWSVLQEGTPRTSGVLQQGL